MIRYSHYTPVVDKNGNPLMPTKLGRAFNWVRSRRATWFVSKGLWCVRLNDNPSGRKMQPVTVGVDPGSCEEGITLKSVSHTYLNIQIEAITWVKEHKKTQKDMRHNRRQRKTPYRKCRWNRAIGCIPPSTKARWDLKLRVINWLCKLFPINRSIVEDVKAKSKGKKKWDKNFSPLQVGKKYFYQELKKIGTLDTKRGFETKELRDRLGLKKLSNKRSKNFYAHCVDSWVLANYIVGGHVAPDNTKVFVITPLKFHRRQLHVLKPKNGVRKAYGGTRSMDFKRGSLVKHKKHGVCYVGGTSKERISLHNVKTTKRLVQNAKVEDCEFLCFNSWLLN